MKLFHTVIIAWTLVTCAFNDSHIAHAQATAETAIEGYIFNAATLQPLRGAYVFISFSDPNSETGTSLRANVDENGFYSQTFQMPAPPVTLSLLAVCLTQKGKVERTIPF